MHIFNQLFQQLHPFLWLLRQGLFDSWWWNGGLTDLCSWLFSCFLLYRARFKLVVNHLFLTRNCKKGDISVRNGWLGPESRCSQVHVHNRNLFAHQMLPVPALSPICVHPATPTHPSCPATPGLPPARPPSSSGRVHSALPGSPGTGATSSSPGTGSQLNQARLEALLSVFPKEPTYLVASLSILFAQVAFDYVSHLNMVSVPWSLAHELFVAGALYLLHWITLLKMFSAALPGWWESEMYQWLTSDFFNLLRRHSEQNVCMKKIYIHIIYTCICIYNYLYIHLCLCGFYIYCTATRNSWTVQAGPWHPGVQAPGKSAEKGM